MSPRLLFFSRNISSIFPNIGYSHPVYSVKLFHCHPGPSLAVAVEDAQSRVHLMHA